MRLDPKALAKIAAAPIPTPADIMRARTSIVRNPRAGGDLRGSAQARRRRTQKLLAEFGDGETCDCVYCGTVLTAATLTQDKIYPADLGGGYRYVNLLPACLKCNQKRSNASVREFITEANAAAEAARALLFEE